MMIRIWREYPTAPALSHGKVRLPNSASFGSLAKLRNRGEFCARRPGCVKRRRVRGSSYGRLVTLFGCIQQRLVSYRIVGKLGPVPSLAFLPFGWTVVERATQIAAGR